MDWVYVGFNEKPQEGSEEREVGWVVVFFFFFSLSSSFSLRDVWEGERYVRRRYMFDFDNKVKGDV